MKNSRIAVLLVVFSLLVVVVSVRAQVQDVGTVTD